MHRQSTPGGLDELRERGSPKRCYDNVFLHLFVGALCPACVFVSPHQGLPGPVFCDPPCLLSAKLCRVNCHVVHCSYAFVFPGADTYPFRTGHSRPRAPAFELWERVAPRFWPSVPFFWLSRLTKRCSETRFASPLHPIVLRCIQQGRTVRHEGGRRWWRGRWRANTPRFLPKAV